MTSCPVAEREPGSGPTGASRFMWGRLERSRAGCRNLVFMPKAECSCSGRCMGLWVLCWLWPGSSWSRGNASVPTHPGMQEAAR